MKKNRLGKSSIFVSEIGLGCMSLPDIESDAIQLVHQAIDKGVTFFDTADLYGQGQNELILGKAIKGKRPNVILSTKVGNQWTPGKEGWHWNPSKTYIKEAVTSSLQRLQTDYIDLYQLHGGTLEDPIDEIIEAFEELKDKGYIRAYGISSIRPNVIREYVRRSQIVSVMMQYSILDRRPEETILPLLYENDIHVIVRGPMAKGILSERTLQNPKTLPTEYLDYTAEELLRLVHSLSTYTDTNRTFGHLALRYPLAHPAVATVIPGASRIEQLLQNIAASDIPPLTDDELQKIRTWSKKSIYHTYR